MNDHKALERGDRARKFLESDEWKEAWQVYTDKLAQEFRACKSDDLQRLQQIKLLQVAGESARAHLESLMVNGKVAAAQIELDRQKQSRLQRVLQAIK